MEGPSSRLPPTQDGALCPAGRRDSGADAECDPARDIKTHFRVCRFIMETGKPLCVRVMWVLPGTENDENEDKLCNIKKEIMMI